MEYLIEKKGSVNGDYGLNVDDLLDFTHGGDDIVEEEEEPLELELGCGGDDVAEGNFSAETSTVSTAVDSCNSSFSGGDHCFVGAGAGAGLSGDLCEPQLDVLAELEWISNYGEESFSSEDLQKLQIISPSGIKSNILSANPVIKTKPISTTIKTEPTYTATTIPSPSSSFSNRHSAAGTYHVGNLSLQTRTAARSKRSLRPSKIWQSVNSSISSSKLMDSNITNPILVKKPFKQLKKKEPPIFALAPPSGGRRCLHCETDKTPQWRTGPMGPKTLCNACGVRYKSGRLVPEYRPAASPTFTVAKHSNSHRKVLELRRQKDVHVQHLHHQQLFLRGASPVHAQNADDFLIHHQISPDYRQLI